MLATNAADGQAVKTNIDALNFAMIDLNLYLDIYPNDANRIKLYNEYNKKTNDLISKYNNTYEPLTLSGNELNEVPWSWEDSPWPWEGV